MKKNRILAPARILLPREGVDLSRWAVLACDQFTSQPDYWQRVRDYVGDAPSCLDLILPEVYLNEPDVDRRIDAIHRAMAAAQADILTRAVDGFLFLRRTTASGVREGLVAAVDLEQYSYAPGERPRIRPTERTVTERIPPRLAVRRGAPLECPHILMLADDPGNTLLGPLSAAADRSAPLYDTPLMFGGGRIAGWAVTDPALIEGAIAAVEAFARRPGPDGQPPIALAVGDGNHSLATAKAWWEEVKKGLSPAETAAHPARYCLVEIENIHDPAIRFEPIHRAVFGANADALPEEMTRFFAAQGAALRTGPQAADAGAAAQRFTLLAGGRRLDCALTGSPAPLCVGSIEAFLADWLSSHPGARVDYIHGEDSLAALAAAGAVGLLLPPFEKADLFRGVYLGGVLPKKTFSMGHAEEKRYYLECRAIV